MRVNKDLKHINKIHNIFFACIFHNMEFAYGNCSAKTMIENITDDILCIYNDELPSDTIKNIRESSPKVLKLYQKVFEINISETGSINRTGLLKAFYFLCLCFMETSEIAVSNNIIFPRNILDSTYKIFFDKENSENKIQWAIFLEELKKKTHIQKLGEQLAELINPQCQGTKPSQLEQLFLAVCKLYATIYISEKKLKENLDIYIELDIELDCYRKGTKPSYHYIQRNNSGSIDRNFLKVWNCYCYCENTIEQIQEREKAELGVVTEDIDKIYLNYKKDVQFVCITYMVLNWLDDDKYKSLKPFENTTSIIDLQKLWFTLSDTNCFADVREKYSNKNDAASKFIKSTSRLVIPVTDVTKEAIEASINTFVAKNPESAVAEALSAGTHMIIENIDNINKTITIVFDIAWGKALPDDAYDEMSEAYHSGCIDSVEEYVKKLHFIHGCNPADITECLDQIIEEAESDDEECMACLLDSAEEFVENALTS